MDQLHESDVLIFIFTKGKPNPKETQAQSNPILIALRISTSKNAVDLNTP